MSPTDTVNTVTPTPEVIIPQQVTSQAAPSQPVMPQTVIQPNMPQKKNRTLLWVLLGCGGCFLLVAIVSVILALVVFLPVINTSSEALTLVSDTCTAVTDSRSIDTYFTKSVQNSFSFPNDSMILAKEMKGCTTVGRITTLDSNSINGSSTITLKASLLYQNGGSKVINAKIIRENGALKFQSLSVDLLLDSQN